MRTIKTNAQGNVDIKTTDGDPATNSLNRVLLAIDGEMYVFSFDEAARIGYALLEAAREIRGRLTREEALTLASNTLNPERDIKRRG